MDTRNRQRLLVFAGLAVSAIFLYIAFRGLNPASVLVAVRGADPLLIVIACVWFFASVVVIALRWRFLLRGIKPVPLEALFGYTCIGYMGNNVYPFRVGEVLRLVLLQRQYGVAFGRGAVVTIVERVFDALVMLSFIVIGVALLPQADPTLSAITTATAPVFIIALLVFFVLAARSDWLLGLTQAVARLLPGKLGDLVRRLGEEIAAGLAGLRSPLDLASTVLCSYGTWALGATVYWLVAAAFNLPVGLPEMLLAVGAVNLAGLIPASPGQFGVFETMVILALASVEAPREQITAYAFVVHMVIWLPVTAVGFVLLVRQGLGLRILAKAHEFEEKAVA